MSTVRGPLLRPILTQVAHACCSLNCLKGVTQKMYKVQGLGWKFLKAGYIGDYIG